MINDKKRREVAKKMREYDVAQFKESAIVPFLECLEHGYMDWRGILDELADLIDPTCHLVGTTSEEGLYGPTIFHHELSCGHTCDTAWPEPPAFCDECGARVVEKEEDDEL
nr:MAG TPA: Nin one binding (NOB1) Zn-ribbon like [Caudoviricetes sp.]